MSDQLYHPIYQQAKDLQYKFHDYVREDNHPAAHVLRTEIHNLVEDIEKQKNPLSIENRVKIIQHQLQQIEHQGHTFMNYEHANYLHSSYDRMREDIRHLHHTIG